MSLTLLDGVYECHSNRWIDFGLSWVYMQESFQTSRYGDDDDNADDDDYMMRASRVGR